MTKWLVRIFIKDYESVKDPKVRERYGVLSGVCGIILNTSLGVMKLIVGLLAGSVAVLADAANNLQDSLTSVFTLLGFKIAAKPADKEHPFGHGRVEYIFSIIIAAFIIIVGYEFLRSSIQQIFNPEPMYVTWVVIAVMVFSIAAKLWQAFFNRHLGKAVNSDMLYAVSTDSRNDVIITTGILFSLVFTQISGILIDGYVGAGVSLVLLYSGIKIIKDTLWVIIGKPADEATVKQITDIVAKYEGINSQHSLIIHDYGVGQQMATLHVVMPEDMPLGKVNEIIDKASQAVLDELGIVLVIHPDEVSAEC